MKKIYPFLLLFIMASFGVDAQSVIPKVWGVDGMISSIASDNHYTYIGGKFTYYGPNTGSGVKITNEDVHPDSSFPLVRGTIKVSVSDGHGGWYIGGKFSKVGNKNRFCLAQIRSDGTVTDWNPGNSKLFSKITTITSIAFDDSAVYVAGYFLSAQTGKEMYLFKTDKKTGKVDALWNPAPDQAVYTIAVSDSFAYVGGIFDKIDGQHRNFIARLNKKTGKLDKHWLPLPDAAVNTIVLNGHTVYIGGQFNSLWGVGAAWYAAKLNDTNGAPVYPFWDPYPDGYVDKIILDGNHVILAGQFHHILRNPVTTINRTFLARFDNSLGKVDLYWDPEPDSYVNDVVVKDNHIYVAGDFKQMGGTDVRYITRVDHFYGGVDGSWMPHTDGPVLTMAFNENNLYVGGDFFSFGGERRNNILRLKNSDLSLDMRWHPIIDNSVTTVISDKDSVYIAGNFNTVNYHHLRYLAKLSVATGEPDTNWKYGPSAPVQNMVQQGKYLYICGDFTSVGSGVGSHNLHYLARMNKSNGLPDVNWHPDPSGGLPMGGLNALAVDTPYIYTAGRFYDNDRQNVINYFRRISVNNGKEDPSWQPRPNGLVWDIKINNQYVYAAGAFSYIGGSPHRNIVRLNKQMNNADDTWNPDADGVVETLAINHNYVYAGGRFTSIGGKPLKNLARITLCSGKADANWQPVIKTQTIFSPEIEKLTFAGNRLFTSGTFNYLNDTMHNNFAVFQQQTEPGPEKIKTIALGQGSFSLHSMAIRSDGKAYTWGTNNHGQLGNNSTQNSSVPVAVDTSGVLSKKKIIQVAMGYWYSMALTADGKVYSWGENEEGVLGNNSTTGSKIPVAVDTTGVLKGKKIVAIAISGVLSMALDSEGKVYTWGYGAHGALGDNSRDRSLVPVAVDTSGVLHGKRIAAISAGANYGVAVDNNGKVYAWGRNNHGKLGNHSTADSSLVPVRVDTTGVLSGKTIVAVAAGLNHTLVLTSDGTLYAWGDNKYGQLGNNSFKNSNIPVAVDMTGVMAGKKVITIAAGGDYCLALTSDGKIYSWGENNVGQLGNRCGTSNVPVAVDMSGTLAGKSIVAIAAGALHSLAMSCDGHVFAWGNNAEGELGNNTFENSTLPVQVVWKETTAVEQIPTDDATLFSAQNFPNPVHTHTTFRYIIPATLPGSQQKKSMVSLKVYDLFGRLITTLVTKTQSPGKYTVRWNAGQLPGGIYFYRLRVNNRYLTRKFVVQR